MGVVFLFFSLFFFSPLQREEKAVGVVVKCCRAGLSGLLGQIPRRETPVPALGSGGPAPPAVPSRSYHGQGLQCLCN